MKYPAMWACWDKHFRKEGHTYRQFKRMCQNRFLRELVLMEGRRLRGIRIANNQEKSQGKESEKLLLSRKRKAEQVRSQKPFFFPDASEWLL